MYKGYTVQNAKVVYECGVCGHEQVKMLDIVRAEVLYRSRAKEIDGTYYVSEICPSCNRAIP